MLGARIAPCRVFSGDRVVAGTGQPIPPHIPEHLLVYEDESLRPAPVQQESSPASSADPEPLTRTRQEEGAPAEPSPENVGDETPAEDASDAGADAGTAGESTDDDDAEAPAEASADASEPEATPEATPEAGEPEPDAQPKAGGESERPADETPAEDKPAEDKPAPPARPTEPEPDTTKKPTPVRTRRRRAPETR